jgi:hypothetical protein
MAPWVHGQNTIESPSSESEPASETEFGVATAAAAPSLLGRLKCPARSSRNRKTEKSTIALMIQFNRMICVPFLTLVYTVCWIFCFQNALSCQHCAKCFRLLLCSKLCWHYPPRPNPIPPRPRGVVHDGIDTIHVNRIGNRPHTSIEIHWDCLMPSVLLLRLHLSIATIVILDGAAQLFVPISAWIVDLFTR